MVVPYIWRIPMLTGLRYSHDVREKIVRPDNKHDSPAQTSGCVMSREAYTKSVLQLMKAAK